MKKVGNQMKNKINVNQKKPKTCSVLTGNLHVLKMI